MRNSVLFCTFLMVLVLSCTATVLASPAPVAINAAPEATSTPTCSLNFEALSAVATEASPVQMERPGSAPAEPEWLAAGFKRYCRCSCSSVPNCNTSADCGGSACLAGITCC
jgi:hypothetical protein